MALTGDVYDESSDVEERTKQQPPVLTEAVLAEHDEATGVSETNDVNDGDASSQVGAGLLAGVTGLFLGGPILGAVTGESLLLFTCYQIPRIHHTNCP